MKRVLIITYYWPPSAGAGVQRWLKFAKYLPSFGWQPIIYTPENPDFDLKDSGLIADIPKDCVVLKNKIREPYAAVKLFSGNKPINTGIVGDGKNKSKSKKLLNWIRGNFFIPDPRVMWRKPSVKFLSRYLEENKVDLIVTTGPPHSMHLIGLDLKKRLGLPWIVDIRDPWSKLDFLDTFHVTDRNRKKYEQMESDVLNSCDQVIATSYSMPELLQPFPIEKFSTITNGYDVDDFANYTPQSSDRFVIYHAGLLNKLRNPVHLWKALRIKCQVDVEFKANLLIHLVGNIDTDISSELLSDPILGAHVKIEGYKDHEEVINDYANASLLLLLINNTDNSKVNIPGKLFELLAASKAILAFGKDDDDAVRIVKESGHRHVNYSATIEEKGLNSILNAKIEMSGSNYGFSRKSLTHGLVKQLEELINSGNKFGVNSLNS